MTKYLFDRFAHFCMRCYFPINRVNSLYLSGAVYKRHTYFCDYCRGCIYESYQPSTSDTRRRDSKEI